MSILTKLEKLMRDEKDEKEVSEALTALFAEQYSYNFHNMTEFDFCLSKIVIKEKNTHNELRFLRINLRHLFRKLKYARHTLTDFDVTILPSLNIPRVILNSVKFLNLLPFTNLRVLNIYMAGLWKRTGHKVWRVLHENCSTLHTVNIKLTSDGHVFPRFYSGQLNLNILKLEKCHIEDLVLMVLQAHKWSVAVLFDTKNLDQRRVTKIQMNLLLAWFERCQNQSYPIKRRLSQATKRLRFKFYREILNLKS